MFLASALSAFAVVRKALRPRRRDCSIGVFSQRNTGPQPGNAVQEFARRTVVLLKEAVELDPDAAGRAETANV